MTEEERDDLIDLLPKDMVIWGDESELESFSWTARRWLDALGHKKLHTACCASCGCAITCVAGAFHDSLIASVVRELDKIGALRMPAPSPGRTTDG